MTAAKITPGPWFVHIYPTSYGIKGGPEGLAVATVTLGYRREHLAEEKHANAVAIAAVPALIEALEAYADGATSPQFAQGALRAAGVLP